MCSKAVGYASNGKAVDIFVRIPKPLIKFKPDWDKKEVISARELEYYESDRALGYMFQSITLPDSSEPIDGFLMTPPGMIFPLSDPISRALVPLLQNALNAKATCACTVPGPAAAKIPRPEELHACYASEMRWATTRDSRTN